MPKEQPPRPPKEALADAEPNRFLAKVKASVCKRWSTSQMKSLYEIADLAVYLWALDRPREALAIAGAVAASVPAPPRLPKGGENYNVWCPATHAHALVAHLGRTTSPKQAEASRAALLANAGISRDNPDYLASVVANARREAEVPPDPKGMKGQCESVARAVGKMVLFAELAAAGDAFFARHASGAASLVPQLLAKLGSRIKDR